MKKTKIIATISDMSNDRQRFIDIYNAGVNVIRFNFSHAQQSAVAEILTTVRELNAAGLTNLSTLLDTKGPEIRTGTVEEKIPVKKGDLVKIYVDQSKVETPHDLFCDYPYLLEDITKDQILIIDSGLLKGKVVEVTADYAVLEMSADHLIGSRRHINLPGVKLKLPGLTDKDIPDVIFAAQQGMDFIAASFVRSRANILQIRELLAQYNASHIQIISKIENQEALENLEEIAQESDGIMVARGDLGVEVDICKLPFYQKEIMDMSFKYGKTIIVATELLKSMVENPFPTRAEVSDVYNSVVLRADCTMLSDETAMGKFPVQSVQMMNDVLAEAETHTNNKHKDFEIVFTDKAMNDKKVVAKSALYIADESKADSIILFTNSGFLAKVVSALKPNQTVFAFTPNEHILRSMNLLYAVCPFMINAWGQSPIEDEKNAITILKEKGLLKEGNKVVVINDIMHGEAMSPYAKIIHL